MARLEEVRQKSAKALQLIREVIDESLEIMAGGREEAQGVTALWEEFLREFLAYLKKKAGKPGAIYLPLSPLKESGRVKYWRV